MKKWIDVEKQDEATNPGFEIDSHVRVWGRLKSFSNKRHVGAHVIRPVTDFNEVNYHLLEATYVHLFYTKAAPGQLGADGDSMFVDGGAGYNNGDGGINPATNSKLANATPNARKMYAFMKNMPGGNEGAHLNVIAQGVNMPIRDVLLAADELLGQGLIYTTVDDETWAILDF